MSALTVGSLFSGIGGIDLGLTRAGMVVRWQVEIDDWCRRVLAKHWPDVTRYGDITEVDPTELEPVDVIAGGFPCQSVSLAGRRQGQDDARWLWPAFIGIVRVVRPRFVLVENTPGLLSLGMGDVLGDLAASGYDAEWDCIPAAALGAIHRRDRVWILAYDPSPRCGTWPCAPRRQVRNETRRTEPERRIGATDDAHDSGCLFPPNPVFAGRHAPVHADWWLHQPGVGRVVHGVSDGVDRPSRIRGLGNSVVPQVVEHIGRLIVSAA